jgi:hypothetical protein
MSSRPSLEVISLLQRYKFSIVSVPTTLDVRHHLQFHIGQDSSLETFYSCAVLVEMHGLLPHPKEQHHPAVSE